MNYGQLWPKCNEWRNCKTILWNVQRWVNKYSRWKAKWSAICSWAILFKSVHQKICERWCFTISELWFEFPQISYAVLYEPMIVRLGYYKCCARRVPKMLKDEHKMLRMASALTFSQWYHKDSDQFLIHIMQATGDETWVSFINIEAKEQSK
jgi:hypothetical protein